MSSAPKKISIVTPSLNCAHMLRDCIESVLSQNYPSFEHIVIDGGSTDGTIEILKQYSHLRWISEPDSGEANALNKGLKLMTGDVLNWLNADDRYFDSGTLLRVSQEIDAHPNDDVWFGKGLAITDQNEIAWYRVPLYPVTLARLIRWIENPQFFQPAMFYSKKLIQALGPFREDIKYGIDYEYWLRIAAHGFTYHYIDAVLAFATLVREGAKSGGSVEEQHMQWQALCEPYVDKLIAPERVNYWRDYYIFRIRNPANYQRPLEVPHGFEQLQGLVIGALELGHMPSAVAAVTALTNEHPERPETYWMLSEILYRSGDRDTAKNAFAHGNQLSARAPLSPSRCD